MVKVNFNGIEREATAEEQAEYDARQIEAANQSANLKLERIREMRNDRLQATDFYALSDVTMSDEMKTYRQGLRDLPQNNTTEEQYDALLARDSDGNLTHNVWSKP